MFYINYINTIDELVDMCYVYRLPFSPNKTKEFTSINEIAEFALQNTFSFFPEDFVSMWEAKKDLDKFKQDIIHFIIFVTAWRLEYAELKEKYIEQVNGKKKRNNSPCYYSNMNEFFRSMIKRNEDVLYVGYNESTFYRHSNALKGQNKYFNKLSDNTHILKWQEYYAFYSMNQVSERPSNYSNRDGRKYKYQYMQKFVEDFQQYINKSNERYKAISYYLIERDYNFELLLNISDLMIKHKINFTNSSSEFISYFCLLPNVNNRHEYVDTIFLLLKEYLKNKTLDIFNEGSYGFSSFLFDEQAFSQDIIKKLKRIIVQISMVSIPLIENYAWYILQNIRIDNVDLFNSITKSVKKMAILNASLTNLPKNNAGLVSGFNKVANPMMKYWSTILAPEQNLDPYYFTELRKDNYLSFLKNEILHFVDEEIDKIVHKIANVK